MLVAALLGIPTVVLEPNAKPGFTNRVLKPFVRHAACSYDEARREFGSKGVVTGNPVRGGFAKLALTDRLVLEWHKWVTSLDEVDGMLAERGLVRRCVITEDEHAGVAVYDRKPS